MSQRRLILICLLVIPAILFAFNLANPAGSADEHNGLEIISLVLSIPIILLNILEWQQPGSLDGLLRPNFLPEPSGTPAKAYFFRRFVLMAIGALFFVYLGITVFSAASQAFGIIPSATAEPSLDVGAIKTAAVETVLADQALATPLGITPRPTPKVTATKNPLTTPRSTALIDTPEAGASTPDPNQPPPDNPQPEDTLPPGPELPTDTPGPTLPDPILEIGSGNSVVNIDKWTGPAVLSATHDGDGNFTITNYSAANVKLAQLVNVTGPYYGTLPLDFMTSEQTTRFEITATGGWELQVIPIEQARTEYLPTTIEGYGDDVIMLSGGDPDQLKIDASGSTDNFVINGFGSGNWYQLLSKTAPYTGTITATTGTTALAVTANGSWSIQVTLR
jgi:hypothetical protein